MVSAVEKTVLKYSMWTSVRRNISNLEHGLCNYLLYLYLLLSVVVFIFSFSGNHTFK